MFIIIIIIIIIICVVIIIMNIKVDIINVSETFSPRQPEILFSELTSWYAQIHIVPLARY